MPKGFNDIPSLHHTQIRRIVADYVLTMPTMRFAGVFPVVRIPSDTVIWESELGSGGISPFVSPGAPAPTIGIDGVTGGSASVAYWKEKGFMDEQFLNNLRRPGTMEGDTSTRQLAKMLRKLIYRSRMREEWMAARALLDGHIVYTGGTNGVHFDINFGRPAMNTMVLADNRKWGNTSEGGGADSNPVEDIYDAKNFMSEQYSINVNTLTMNTNTMKRVLFNAKIQDLLKSSSFGNGDLFARPETVLGNLFGIGNWVVNDESYEMAAMVQAVTSPTVFVVDNATDFEVGSKLYIERFNERFRGESRKITAVNKSAGIVTVDSAYLTPPTPGRDNLVMSRKFIADNQVLLHTANFQGQPIGQYMQSPFGIPTHYGMFTDSEPVWDPDGLFLRVQNKGLPVVYSPQATFTMIVA